MKKLFYLASVAIVALVMGACNGIAPSKPNLYVCVDDPSRGEELYYITYIPEGRDGHSGRNIFGDQKGTYNFKGKTYRMFSIPKGTWDIYMEWWANTGYASINYNNERLTVNTKLNDWVRIEFYSDKDHTSCRAFQGSGEMY